MKLRWFIPIVVLLPLPLRGSEPVPPARIATIVINTSEVTPLHLRPQFDSVIRMPEEITSVVLGRSFIFRLESLQSAGRDRSSPDSDHRTQTHQEEERR